MQASDNLERKQYVISHKQIEKLELLAKKQRTSAAYLVRAAIDAYDPDIPVDMKESELLDFVSVRIKEAIADTQETRKLLESTLPKLVHHALPLSKPKSAGNILPGPATSRKRRNSTGYGYGLCRVDEPCWKLRCVFITP